MTPERKQWWDSLSQREKLLREQILAVARLKILGSRTAAGAAERLRSVSKC